MSLQTAIDRAAQVAGGEGAMRVIHGVVKDGQIVLDDGMWLPEGMEVQVMLVPPPKPAEDATEEEREELFQRWLLATGKVERLPRMDPAAEIDWEPIEIDGPPLSETLIRDRR